MAARGSCAWTVLVQVEQTLGRGGGSVGHWDVEASERRGGGWCSSERARGVWRRGLWAGHGERMEAWRGGGARGAGACYSRLNVGGRARACVGY
jgi:hypothetical protein